MRFQARGRLEPTVGYSGWPMTHWPNFSCSALDKNSATGWHEYLRIRQCRWDHHCAKLITIGLIAAAPPVKLNIRCMMSLHLTFFLEWSDRPDRCTELHVQTTRCGPRNCRLGVEFYQTSFRVHIPKSHPFLASNVHIPAKSSTSSNFLTSRDGRKLSTDCLYKHGIS